MNNPPIHIAVMQVARCKVITNELLTLCCRLAQFHILMARLDNVSGKFKDSNAHLHTVAFILNSKSPTISNEPPDNQNDDTEHEQPETASNSDGGDFIKSQNLEFEEQFNDVPAGGTSTEQAASPKHHKEQFEPPKIWTHSVACDCEHCHDINTVRISLLYVLAHCELVIMEGKYSLGRTHLLALLGKVQHFTKRSEKLLKAMVEKSMKLASETEKRLLEMTSVGGGAGLTKRENVVVKASVYQNVAIEGCKLMVYEALVDLDLNRHEVLILSPFIM